MPSFDHSKKPDLLYYCPFPKHEGEKWVDVVENDSEYIEWLLSGEGPYLSERLTDKLTWLLEGDEEE